MRKTVNFVERKTLRVARLPDNIVNTEKDNGQYLDLT